MHRHTGRKGGGERAREGGARRQPVRLRNDRQETGNSETDFQLES